MKGLLIKDYKLIMHNKRMFLILMVVWFLAFQNYAGYSFLIAYSTMIFILLALNTISTDEYYKSTPFLLTLPVKRETYTAEKYVLMLGLSLLGTALSTLLCILVHRNLLQELILEGVSIYIILVLFQLLMIPIQLKFGNDKGRIVLLGLLAVVAGIASSIGTILPLIFSMQGSIAEMLTNAVQWFIGLPIDRIVAVIILTCTVCFAVSYGCSLHIMRKKEF